MERPPWPAAHGTARIVNELFAFLLQLIHEGIFLVRIKGLVKSAERQQIRAASEEVAQN